jgi:hypothetical protein
MGILGEIPRAEMIKKLQGEVAKWQAADSTTTATCFTLYCSNSTGGRPEEKHVPHAHAVQTNRYST